MSTTEAKIEREWNSEIKEIGDKIVNLTGLQAKELSDYIKEVHGIEPATGGAVMVAAAPGGGEEEEGKDEGPAAYDVLLTNTGQKAVQVYKALKEILGTSIIEAKKMAANLPLTVKEKVESEEAEQIRTKLEEAGGVVELKAK